jgi:hypothetical protein
MVSADRKEQRLLVLVAQAVPHGHRYLLFKLNQGTRSAPI